MNESVLFFGKSRKVRLHGAIKSYFRKAPARASGALTICDDIMSRIATPADQLQNASSLVWRLIDTRDGLLAADYYTHTQWISLYQGRGAECVSAQRAHPRGLGRSYSRDRGNRMPVTELIRQSQYARHTRRLERMVVHLKRALRINLSAAEACQSLANALAAGRNSASGGDDDALQRLRLPGYGIA